jgi:hypothetical protein
MVNKPWKMVSPLARDEENVLFHPGCLAGLNSHEQGTLVRTKDRVDIAFRQLYAQTDCHSQYLNQHITWLTPQLERYLETGLVRKSPG